MQIIMQPADLRHHIIQFHNIYFGRKCGKAEYTVLPHRHKDIKGALLL